MPDRHAVIDELCELICIKCGEKKHDWQPAAEMGGGWWHRHRMTGDMHHCDAAIVHMQKSKLSPQAEVSTFTEEPTQSRLQSAWRWMDAYGRRAWIRFEDNDMIIEASESFLLDMGGSQYRSIRLSQIERET